VQCIDSASGYFEEEWPTYLQQASGAHTEVSAEYLQKVWLAEINDPYGEAAVVCTIAVLLKQFDKKATQQQCLDLAKQFWQKRDKSL
jgi:hypothetical protein